MFSKSEHRKILFIVLSLAEALFLIIKSIIEVKKFTYPPGLRNPALRGNRLHKINKTFEVHSTQYYKARITTVRSYGHDIRKKNKRPIQIESRIESNQIKSNQSIMFTNTLVTSLLLSLLLATTTGGSSRQSGVRVPATAVLLGRAGTSSVVSSVEEDVEEDGNHNEDGPISGGGVVVEEPPPPEPALPWSTTTRRRRTLHSKTAKASSTANPTEPACVSPGGYYAAAKCCYGKCLTSANLNSCEQHCLPKRRAMLF